MNIKPRLKGKVWVADVPTGERLPMIVKKGDEVKFAAFAGKEIKVDGKEYFLMPESDVQGVISK